MVQPFDLLAAQLDAVGGIVLLDAGNPLGGERHDEGNMAVIDR
jgi:hypothetical protein